LLPTVNRGIKISRLAACMDFRKRPWVGFKILVSDSYTCRLLRLKCGPFRYMRYAECKARCRDALRG
jgi:hypothetical protein